MAKGNEKTELKSAGFQVIENLSSMLVREFGASLKLEDYFLVAHKIGETFLAENPPSVIQRQTRLGDCRNVAMAEFNAQTFLIHRLVKSAALVLVTSKQAPISSASFGVFGGSSNSNGSRKSSRISWTGRERGSETPQRFAPRRITPSSLPRKQHRVWVC